jgi:hypothetical protein
MLRSGNVLSSRGAIAIVIPSVSEGPCVKYSWPDRYDDVTEGPSSLALLGMTLEFIRPIRRILFDRSS